MADHVLTNGYLGEEKIEVIVYRDNLIVELFSEMKDRTRTVARRGIIGFSLFLFLGNLKSKQICK